MLFDHFKVGTWDIKHTWERWEIHANSVQNIWNRLHAQSRRSGHTRSNTKIMRQFCKSGTNSGRGKMNRWYLTLKYALTMWQVSFFLLHLIAVVSCFRTDMLLHLVRKCLIQKVSHKTTLSFSSNLRNPWQKLIWKWTLGVRATAKIHD